MLLTILATITVIGILVTVHELGHFVAARAVGVYAPRFSVGFGPRLFGFTWRDTEFVVCAVPLGGYVKLAGMDDEAPVEKGPTGADVPVEQLYSSKPVWARGLILIGGVAFNMLFALAIFCILPLVHGVPDPTPAEVSAIDDGVLPKSAAALATRETPVEIVRINGERITDWEDLRTSLLLAPKGPTTIEFAEQPPVTITLSGEIAEREQIVAALAPSLPAVIGHVAPGSPAARAGLRVGDEILRAAGVEVEGWHHLVGLIQTNPSQEFPMTVLRDGEKIEVVAQLGKYPGTGENTLGWMGIARDGGWRDVGLAGAIQQGLQETWDWTRTTAITLGRIGTGEISPSNIGGPLMIGEVSGETARLGLGPFLAFMALFSINLAAFNLLPIPILDGGHLFFLVIEAIRGKPLSAVYRVAALRVGMVVILLVMGWALVNDLRRAIFGA